MSGPLPRKKMYRYLIRRLFENGFFDDWRQTQEICREANKDVPARWTQIYPSSVYRYVRQLPVEERHRWDSITSSMIREWKKL